MPGFVSAGAVDTSNSLFNCRQQTVLDQSVTVKLHHTLKVSPYVSFAECLAQVDVHNNLGDLWRAQGQVGRQAAQQCYSESLRIDNSYAPAWRGLGDMFRENGEHQQAVTCYQVTFLCSGACNQSEQE